jgi:hypothetical protein
VLMGMTVADAILDRDHDSLLQDTRGLISTTLWYTIDTTMLPARVFRRGKDLKTLPMGDYWVSYASFANHTRVTERDSRRCFRSHSSWSRKGRALGERHEILQVEKPT